MSIVLISILGYSQVTNVGEFRVATATTDFGVNLPIGTKVYNIATGEYWVATAGVASTEDLTSASASFTLLNNSGTDDQELDLTGNILSIEGGTNTIDLSGYLDNTDSQTAAQVDITDSGNNYDGTTVEAALSEIGDSIAAHNDSISALRGDINTINSAGYLTSEVDGSTTNEIQDLSGSGSTLSGYVIALSDDGTSVTLPNEADGSVTNEIQTLDVAQLDGTNLELSLSSDGEATHQIDLSSIAGTDDQGLSYNSGTHAIDIENGTSAVIPLALDDGATEGLASFTASDFTVTSGNVAIDYANGQAATNSQPGFATASQITAIETNTSNISTNASDISTLEAIAKTVTQRFEVGSNSTSATSYTLSVAAATSQACVVSYNGVVLDPTSDYEFASSTSLQINVPVYQYDKIVISYKTAL